MHQLPQAPHIQHELPPMPGQVAAPGVQAICARMAEGLPRRAWGGGNVKAYCRGEIT